MFEVKNEIGWFYWCSVAEAEESKEEEGDATSYIYYVIIFFWTVKILRDT